MRRKAIFSAALLLATIGTMAKSESALPTDDVCEVSTAMDFLAAMGRLDFDAVGSFLDNDAVIEFPYLGAGVTVRGRTEIVKYLRHSMGSAIAGITYNLDQAYPSQEAGALVLEISTQGRTAAGREYTNRLVGVFECRDGRIARFREYFNPGRVE